MSKCYVVYEHYYDIADILKVFSNYEDAVKLKFNLDLEEMRKYLINSTQLCEHYRHGYTINTGVLSELGLPKSCTVGDFWKKF